MTLQSRCPQCDGIGVFDDSTTCQFCDGTGEVDID